MVVERYTVVASVTDAQVPVSAANYGTKKWRPGGRVLHLIVKLRRNPMNSKENQCDSQIDVSARRIWSAKSRNCFLTTCQAPRVSAPPCDPSFGRWRVPEP